MCDAAKTLTNFGGLGSLEPVPAGINTDASAEFTGPVPPRPAPKERASPVSSSRLNIRVLVDFDGTIVPGDVTDHVLGQFAGPKWLELEDAWQTGRMGSRECLAAQVDLIRASPADIARAVNEREIDPAFPEFVDRCHSHGMEVTVVSDGFDLAIETMLKRAGLNLPYYANQLEWLGGERWKLGFPNSSADCSKRAGHCKCQRVADGATRTVVIGDGKSDFCVAAKSDLVLSKSKLTTHCVAQGMRHIAISGFADVVRLFDTWTVEALMAPRRQSMPRRAIPNLGGDILKRPSQLH